MQLIITEKPSQGRALAEALGIKQKGEGCIKSDKIIITWCIGHLVELSPPQDYDPSYEKWELKTLPILPDVFKTKPNKNVLQQFKIVKSYLLNKDVKEVVCATDSGREGELIFDLVYRESGCKKPVKRLWTASLTPEALKDAYAKLRPASDFEGLRASAHCRAQADWLVGLNSTRAQTIMQRFAGGQGVWPVGRVQTPTLSMIVTRDNAIKTFVSKPFWTIRASLEAKAGPYEGQWFTLDDGKNVNQIFDKQIVETVLSRIKGKPALVESVEGKIEKRKPPQFYDLTNLQKDCNRYFGYSADATLKSAQSLYEKGILSYPRTNSRYITPAEEQKLPQILASLPEPYKDFYNKKQLNKLSNAFVDAKKVEDHHAILPTGKMGEMDPNDRNVFDLVARRSIAAYYNDEKTQKTTVITAIIADKFKTIGKVTLDPGWTVLELKSKQDSKEKEDSKPLPKIDKGEAPKVLKIASSESKTQPPKPHTEADLLGAMETAGKDIEDDNLKEAIKDSGLGTPATRASIIEGLLQRELLERKGKTLIPTAKGIELINKIPVATLKSAELTGDWEYKLELVRKGKMKQHEFMAQVKSFTKQVVEEIKKQSPTTQPVQTSVGPCPKCGSELMLKSWKGDFYVKCSATKDANCLVSYGTTEKGVPLGGQCKKCNGPIKITKAKSKVCVSCNTWV